MKFRLFLLLSLSFGMGFFHPLTAQEPQVTQAASARGVGMAPGTSDSGDLENRLLFRVQRALTDEEARSSSVTMGNRTLGAPNGYHWIVLMQVARYRDSNVRMTTMRRGVQRFLEALVNDRKAWPRPQVGDTLSILPYHFSLLGEARGRIKPFSTFLDDSSKIKESVPGLPQDDEYQGQKWRDGHDWRSAMQQTLAWMKASDLEHKHSIIIVLDWNDLAQAPQSLADGSLPTTPATESDLVLPANQARYKSFTSAMENAGFDPAKSLETVQVGNLEYDLAVFTPRNFEPLPTQTSAPLLTQGGDPPPPPGGQSNSAIIFLPFLVLALGAAFFLTRPVNFRLDDEKSAQVAALPARSFALYAQNTQVEGAPYRLQNVTVDTERPLATIETNLSKQLLVNNGALAVRNSQGFQSTPSGLKLVGQNGEFDLVDSSTGRVLATVSVRRL